MGRFEVIMGKIDASNYEGSIVLDVPNSESIDVDEVIGGTKGLIWEHFNREEYYVNDIIDITEWEIIYAAKGKDFQEYVRSNGERVPFGEPVGIEKGDELRLLSNIFFSNTPDKDYDYAEEEMRGLPEIKRG